MSEWTALLERLKQIGAYFAGTEGLSRAAAAKRAPSEPIRAEDELPAEAAGPAASPREAAERLLRSLTPERTIEVPRQQPSGGRERIDDPAAAEFGGGFSPVDPADLPWSDRTEIGTVPGADLHTISQAFRRDARRYDE